VLITQTAGPAVTLRVDHDCWVEYNVTFAGEETKRGDSGTVLTFNTGPRKVQGKMLTPTLCYALLYYQVSGNLLAQLGYAYTLP
jgi:hypothetical protein